MGIRMNPLIHLAHVFVCNVHKGIMAKPLISHAYVVIRHLSEETTQIQLPRFWSAESQGKVRLRREWK